MKTHGGSKEVSGNFTGLVADLGPAISSQGLFQVFVGLDIKGSPNLSYTLYLTEGASVKAQAYTYVPKAATTYELALLSPALVDSAPLSSGRMSSSSLVVRAWAGTITFFRLDSIAIRFLSAPASPPPGGLDPAKYDPILFYYFVFLFVVPVAMLVLVVRVFRDES